MTLFLIPFKPKEETHAVENQWPHCSQWNIKRLIFPLAAHQGNRHWFFIFPFRLHSQKQSNMMADDRKKNNHCPRCHCPDRRLSTTLYCSELHKNCLKQRTLRAHEATLVFLYSHTLWINVCPCNKRLPPHHHFHFRIAINSPLTGRNNAPSLKKTMFIYCK